MFVGFVSHPEFEAELRTELPSSWRQQGRLFWGPADDSLRASWAQDRWPNLQIVDLENPKLVVNRLKKLRKDWVQLPNEFEFEAKKLSAELTSKIEHKKITFLQKLKRANFGVWTTIGNNQIVFCDQPDSPLPFGEIHFAEDRKPPNRAYLKLWELMTVHGVEPKPADFCIDLGAAPGGWTWVLNSLGCRVHAIDRSPLDPFIGKLKGVKFQTGDAFKWEIESVDSIDWIFSDLACYPTKLFESVSHWIQSGRVKNIVCTVKLKGAPSPIEWLRFKNIPNSKLIHLWHNKHELTWYWRQT